MTDKCLQEKQRTPVDPVLDQAALKEVTIDISLGGKRAETADAPKAKNEVTNAQQASAPAVDLDCSLSEQTGRAAQELPISPRTELRRPEAIRSEAPKLKYSASRWPAPAASPHPPTVLDKLITFLANLLKRLVDAFLFRLSKKKQASDELNLEELEVCTPKQMQIIEEERRRKLEVEREAQEYEERIKMQPRSGKEPENYYPKRELED